MLYEVVAHPKTKIICQFKYSNFLSAVLSRKLVGNAAACYCSSQDCRKPVNTSSVLLTFVRGRGCRRVYILRYGQRLFAV
jgi:hypothetical protein